MGSCFGIIKSSWILFGEELIVPSHFPTQYSLLLQRSSTKPQRHPHYTRHPPSTLSSQIIAAGFFPSNTLLLWVKATMPPCRWILHCRIYQEYSKKRCSAWWTKATRLILSRTLTMSITDSFRRKWSPSVVERCVEVYLSGRVSRVHIGGELSGTTSIHSGVPQGSVKWIVLCLKFLPEKQMTDCSQMFSLS